MLQLFDNFLRGFAVNAKGALDRVDPIPIFNPVGAQNHFPENG
jgi:hypothetical protein